MTKLAALGISIQMVPTVGLTYHCNRIDGIDDGEQQDMVRSRCHLALPPGLVCDVDVVVVVLEKFGKKLEKQKIPELIPRYHARVLLYLENRKNFDFFEIVRMNTEGRRTGSITQAPKHQKHVYLCIVKACLVQIEMDSYFIYKQRAFFK